MMEDQYRKQALGKLAQTHLGISPDCSSRDTQKILYDANQVKAIMEATYDAGLHQGLYHHPKYSRIDIEGRNGLRGTYAILTRKSMNRWINMQLLTPTLEAESAVLIDNPEEQWAAAKNLYGELEGRNGSDEQVMGYYQVLRHLSGATNDCRSP